jgi:hypothetical protein
MQKKELTLERERDAPAGIGSLGKSGIERFMIGSVSEKVVRNANVPVLVVH